MPHRPWPLLVLLVMGCSTVVSVPPEPGGNIGGDNRRPRSAGQASGNGSTAGAATGGSEAGGGSAGGKLVGGGAAGAGTTNGGALGGGTVNGGAAAGGKAGGGAVNGGAAAGGAAGGGTAAGGAAGGGTAGGGAAGGGAAGQPAARDPYTWGGGRAVAPAQEVVEVVAQAAIPPSQLITNHANRLDGDKFSVAPAPSSLISEAGASFVANNGAGVISDNGGGIVPPKPNAVVGLLYFPFEPSGGKYQLLQLGMPAFEAARTTATGLTEFVWPRESRVRAIRADGSPLTDWVQTGGAGDFELPLPTGCPLVFFLQGEITRPSDDGVVKRAFALAFAPPPGGRSVASLDASSTMVAVSTLHLVDFIPPEFPVAVDYGETSEKKATNVEKQIPGQQYVRPFAVGSPGFPPRFYRLRQAPAPKPTPDPFARQKAQLASYNNYTGGMEARTGELIGAWQGFDPLMYGVDIAAADGAATAETARAVATAGLRQGYDQMYGLAAAGRFAPRSFWAIAPDTPPPPP